MISIDLNADIGEHDGDGHERDFALLDVVTSASIACGGHAGSDNVMRRTAQAAAERGVAIGAHPGFPDREGFGRRVIEMPAEELSAAISAQVLALRACCVEVGTRVRYVKPHGALYNEAARNAGFAEMLVRAVRDVDATLVLLVLAESVLELEARAAGLSVAREAFIDRAYLGDGTLMPRDNEGAVLGDADIAAERALVMVRDHSVTASDGTSLTIFPDSLCVHGDNPAALPMIRAVRNRLEMAGIAFAPFAK